MPAESLYPKFDIPKEDLWGFLFERKDRDYPDDKGMFCSAPTYFGLRLTADSHFQGPLHQPVLHLCANQSFGDRVWQRTEEHVGVQKGRCSCTIHPKLH